MPKNRGWFRVYDRMIDSPEILELTDTQFRSKFNRTPEEWRNEQ